MANDHSALDAHIRKLRELGGLVERVAPKVAVALERELEANARAGVGPDGKPWAPKQDGGKALQGVPDELRVRAVGTRIVARLTGHYALHDRGRAKGGVRRQILPSGEIPTPVAKAIDAVIDAEFRRTMGAK